MRKHSDSLASIFKAYDIRGKVGPELNNDLCYSVGVAFSNWLVTKDKPLIVGYDMRPDSKSLATALMDGATKTGRNVIDLGMITSDMAVFAIKHLNGSGAAVITASHNPGQYNGIKLYDDTPKTIGLEQGLDKIRDVVLSGKPVNNSEVAGGVAQKNINGEWIDFALSLIDPSLIPESNIAIDAGNGMAGAILPELLEKLPQLSVTAMYFTPDGTFPNHLANPQDLETLVDLQRKVTTEKLDFGIAFDGDGDRMAMIDENARPIPGSEMFSLLALKYLGKDTPFVHEVRTSRIVVKNLEDRTGAKPVRSKSGRSNIGQVMTESSAVFGGETTGHFFFKEYWNNDSGLISMLIALEQIGKNGNKKLSKTMEQHATGSMIPETNFEVDDADLVIEKIAKYYSIHSSDTLDGLSVAGVGWWFNIRKSNTEPLIRLNAEAQDENTLSKIVKDIKDLI